MMNFEWMHACKLEHSHWTTIQTSSVAGFPIPFSAVHLYLPESCLLMPVNGMMTTLLSRSLLHVMFGVGLPHGMHFSVTLSPSVTVWFPEISLMLDKTANKARICMRQ